MRRLPVLLVALCLVGGIVPPGRGAALALPVVRVPVASARQAALVARSFDETHNRVPGHVEILLWPDDAARLAALGLTYEVVVPDVVARDRAESAAPADAGPLPGPDRDAYRTLDDYEAEMRALARRHPDLVRAFVARAETLEGRRVRGVEIAAHVAVPGGRPVLYVDGAHHAREWPSAEYPMMFAHHLVEGFGRNRAITALLRRVRVIVVPVVNPDGFDHSRSSLLSADQTVADATWPTAYGNGFEGYWRKNRRSFSGVTVPPGRNPDAYGVDPNRNYPFLWGARDGSSGFELDATYRGHAPASEPETANVIRLLSRHNVVGLVSNHTYGRLVLRPWGHTWADAPDERLLASAGAHMARALGGYRSLKGIGLYATTGTTSDWAYAATGALAYTLEHGDAFHPAYATVARDAAGVMRAFEILAAAVADPRSHAVVVGRVVDGGGRPVRATLTLTKRFRTPLGRGNPLGASGLAERLRVRAVTGPRGTFEWHVAPSTRPLVTQRGGTEAYRLTVSAPGLGKTAVRVEVARGEALDLGTISL